MSVQDTLEQVINYEVYVEGGRLLGTGSIELPELQFMTQTIKGAGIAGEYEAPTLAHLQSLEMKLTFRALFDKPVELMQQRLATNLSCRGALQRYDPTLGLTKVVRVQVDFRGRPKGINLGKLEPGELTDTEITFECDIISVKIDGKEIFLHDKLNFISRVNGVDQLLDVRMALGF